MKIIDCLNRQQKAFFILLLSCLSLIALQLQAQNAGSVHVNRNTTYQKLSPEELIRQVFIKSGTGCSTIDNVNVRVYNWVGGNWRGSNLDDRSPRGFAYFDNGNTTFPIKNGLVLSTGNVNEIEGPNDKAGYGSLAGGADAGSDPDLESLILDNPNSDKIKNFTVLEFDFTPAGNRMEFKYIFGSEEYPEFSGSKYNDVFGFFVYEKNDISTKQNIALLPNGQPVAINNVNGGYVKPIDDGQGNDTGNGNTQKGYDDAASLGWPCNRPYDCTPQNSAFFVPNFKGSALTQLDGYTKTLVAKKEGLKACVTYHLKIVIGNVTDTNYGSAVFLEANSFDMGDDLEVFGNGKLGMTDIYKGCNDNFLRVHLLPEITAETSVELRYDRPSGGAVNGTHYVGVDDKALPTIIKFQPNGPKYQDIYFKPTDAAVSGSYFDVDLFCLCDDTKGTYVTKRITLYDPITADRVSLDYTKATSAGATDGIIIVDIESPPPGSGKYEYLLADKDGITIVDWQDDNEFRGLAAGDYIVQVRDKGSCKIISKYATSIEGIITNRMLQPQIIR